MDEREPPYSSLLSTFTGCSLDLKVGDKMTTLDPPRRPHSHSKRWLTDHRLRGVSQPFAMLLVAASSVDTISCFFCAITKGENALLHKK